MGALATLQTNRKTFGAGSPLDAFITTELAKRVDADVPSAAAAADSVWTLPEDTVDHTGGTFTLTIAVRQSDGSVQTITTAAIAFNAAAATIEGAIDTAATGNITGWTNGDITVAGGNLQTADVTVTFDGTSVTNRPATVTFNDSMTGGTSPADRDVKTTRGQTERAALGALLNLGIVSGSVPEQDAVATEAAFTIGTNLNAVPDVVIKALMREAAADDANQGTYFSLEDLIFNQDRAPLVEESKTSDVLEPDVG